MKLIVGLGNTGARYETTRHNVGFLLVDELADKASGRVEQNKFFGQFGTGSLFSEKIAFLKPQTMYNASGKSVQACMAFYKLDLDDLVVIHDDIDMDVGRVKAKTSGGHGGNNGIRDIMASLGKDGFHRIKIGIGRPERTTQVSDYVLSSMGDSELLSLQNHVLEEVELRLSEIFKRS